jgi:hypothetical protein
LPCFFQRSSNIEKRESLGDQETYADALVLTEWKKATADGAGAKFEEAVRQAEIYAHGPLTGNELHAYR